MGEVATRMANDHFATALPMARTDGRTNERVSHLPETPSVTYRAREKREGVSRVRVNRDEMRRMHNAGMSAAQIAAALRCNPETVRRWRAAEGLTQPRPAHGWEPLSPERKEAARRLLEDGASYKEVCRTLGMNWRTVRHHFPGKGWTRQEAGEMGSFVAHMKKVERLSASVRTERKIA